MGISLDALNTERRYLQITPTDDPLAPAQVERSITKLHRTDRHGGEYPTYEVLLAATGESDDAGTRSVSWFVGVTPETPAEALDATRRTLRDCLPRSYDIVETTCSYAALLELPLDADPRQDPESAGAADQAITVPSTSAPESDAETSPATDTEADAGTLPEPDGDQHASPDGQPEAADETAMAARLDPAAVASGLTSLQATVSDALSHPSPEPAEPMLPEWEVAGLEYFGVGTRPDDWQLPLADMASFDGDESRPAWPFASVCDGLAAGDAPTLVQVLVKPKPNWRAVRDARIHALENQQDLFRHELVTGIVETWLGTSERRQDRPHPEQPPPTTGRRRDVDQRTTGRRRGVGQGTTTRRSRSGTRDDTNSHHSPTPSPQTSSLAPSETRRIEGLQTVDPSQSFTVNARAIALEREANADAADATLRALADAFGELGDEDYRITGKQYSYGSLAANRLFERVLTRSFDAEPKRRRHVVPLVPNASRAIVADPAAIGGLCLTGGAALSTPARRALAVTPPAKTGLELPPRTLLDRYLSADGMHIGHPKTADRERLEATVSLPPAAHSQHTGVFASTGAGKSALGHDMAAGAFEATEGATILLDSKGDGGSDAYLRRHFARHGDLQDVYHFDCGELLPAVPTLTIEPQLAAGIDRTQAVANVVNGYVELLAGYMGPEQFKNASASVEVIKYLVTALFDPIHGSDAIAQSDILAACGRMHRNEEPPTVSDPYLRESIQATLANSDRSFDNIMSGAGRRIRLASNDARLRQLFEDHSDRDVGFDLFEHLDEQCVIVIDTSDYREGPRQLLTLVIVSHLWQALKRRTEQTPPHAELPQVNLFIEEAAGVANADIIGELLSQGRSFGVGVTLMMQFPQQIRDANPRVFRELINDIGTHVTGRINDPGALATAYTTGDLDRETIATRIANLDRGEWLVRLGDPWDVDRLTPFVCESRPLPPGHPDGDHPLTDSEETTYRAERTLLETRMYRNYGIAVTEHTGTAAAAPDAAESDGDAVTSGPAAPDQGAAATAAAAVQPLQTTIPYTERLPELVTYRDEPPYPYVCRRCETRHPPTGDGLRHAIACCHDLERVERDDVPVTTLHNQLTASERRASDYSDAQLRFLAAVYMAHQQAFDPDLEYDLVSDSMVRLKEYVGIDTDGVRELVDDGLLKRDCDHPHRLYTVTPEGRDEIQVGHRKGVAHGDGKGDLSESSFHVALTEVGKRYLEQLYVANPDSPATAVRKYHDVAEGRLDVAALEADGEVVVALEAERMNNDLAEAVPADYDKMAACDPEQAVWVVKNRAAAHELLQALNDPADADPRVEKTYSERMRPQEFAIDTPGLTDVYTFQSMRNELED